MVTTGIRAMYWFRLVKYTSPSINRRHSFKTLSGYQQYCLNNKRSLGHTAHLKNTTHFDPKPIIIFTTCICTSNTLNDSISVLPNMVSLCFLDRIFFLFPHTYVDKLCGYSIAAFFQSSGAMLGID